MESFRVVALISAFNEGDIISAVIGHLIENGVEVYLLDNHSTDDTVEQAGRWLGRGLIDIETFPAASRGHAAGVVFPWADILRRKEELAQQLGASWYMHHDADEIRESPLPGLTLQQAIQWVDERGYNCIDHVVLNFPAVDDGFRQGADPRTYFRHYEEAAEYDRTQLKTWKGTKAVSLASGGHHAEFVGRRVFPIPFIIRHYPVRSQTHGRRKVFSERKTRFLEPERALGWHVQYDAMLGPDHAFIVERERLRPFDLEQVRLNGLLADNALRNLGERLLRADEQLDALRAEAEELRLRLDEHRRHGETLETERDALQRHATTLDAERDALRRHATNLEVERDALQRHAANLEAERESLYRHTDNLLRELTTVQEHAGTFEHERPVIASLRERAGRHDSSARSAHEEVTRLTCEITQLRSSRSWRWTAPLRWLFSLFRSD